MELGYWRALTEPLNGAHFCFREYDTKFNSVSSSHCEHHKNEEKNTKNGENSVFTGS